MTSEQAQELEQQISKWYTRAQMAYKQGSKELVRSALKKKLYYKKLLNELRRQSDDPPYMSLVPLRQPPSSGAGEIVLPLPKPEQSE